jgi:hypothetical protein
MVRRNRIAITFFLLAANEADAQTPGGLRMRACQVSTSRWSAAIPGALRFGIR